MQDITSPNAVVVDFESAALGTNPAVLSIGAYAFDRFNVAETTAAYKNGMNDFYSNIGLTEQFFLGLEISIDTAEWWRNKNAKQIPEVMKNRKDISVVIPEFFNWLSRFENPIIYCRHTHADFVWLDNICKKLKIKNQIRYNQIFDVCSAVLQATGETKGYIVTGIDRSNSHNALGDAYNDAVMLAMINDPNFNLTPEQILSK